MKYVKIEHHGAIAVVSFDRGTAANPLSNALMQELTQAARSFENDHKTSAIILTGREDTFSMGFDLNDEETRRVQTAGLAERRQAALIGKRMCQAWEDLQPLTISAINGWCVGGGAALSVATDLRVAAENAQFYVPEVERGLNMSWGSVPRLTNLIGPARAKRLMILAEKQTASQALDCGLIDEIAPMGRVMAQAMTTARDHDQFTLAQNSQDAVEGIEAFLEKRDPKFTGN